MSLTDDELERYARHIVLREIGGPGQAAIRAARVLVIGAGGLGSPALLYLAAAGVGTLGIADYDTVSLSNLQRQIAHTTKNIGRMKTESAAETIAAINPGVVVRPHGRLTAQNALEMFADYDVIADGSDNFATRFLVNDAAYFAKKILVSAAVTEFDGQLATFKPHAGDYPCYRCLYPEPPPAGTAPSCSETGVLGAAAGVMGSLQALEVLKEITGAGDSLAGKLLVYEALSSRFRTIKIKPDPECALCSANASLHNLAHHA